MIVLYIIIGILALVGFMSICFVGYYFGDDILLGIKRKLGIETDLDEEDCDLLSIGRLFSKFNKL